MGIKALVWFCSALLFLLLSDRENIIDWNSNNVLSWNDYAAKPNQNAQRVAYTACGIHYEFEAFLDPQFSFVTVDTDIKARFYPKLSWVKKEFATPEILAHERLHFDLTEIYADKFRRIVAETRFTYNVKMEMQVLYSQIQKELDSVQTFYDLETNLSRNRERQKIWDKKVSLWLSLNRVNKLETHIP